jgi:hypothetical protein
MGEFPNSRLDHGEVRRRHFRELGRDERNQANNRKREKSEAILIFY